MNNQNNVSGFVSAENVPMILGLSVDSAQPQLCQLLEVVLLVDNIFLQVAVLSIAELIAQVNSRGWDVVALS